MTRITKIIKPLRDKLQISEGHKSFVIWLHLKLAMDKKWIIKKMYQY